MMASVTVVTALTVTVSLVALHGRRQSPSEGTKASWEILGTTTKSQGEPANRPLPRLNVDQALQPDYRLAPGDILSVELWDLAGSGWRMSKTLRVDPAGNIVIPDIGRVRADGLTAAELESAITAAFEQQGKPHGGNVLVLATAAQRK